MRLAELITMIDSYAIYSHCESCRKFAEEWSAFWCG